jgi:hypothetical protein
MSPRNAALAAAVVVIAAAGYASATAAPFGHALDARSVDAAEQTLRGAEVRLVLRIARSAPLSAFPLGPGPVYPNVGSANGVADLRGDSFSNGWYLHKTLWSIERAYRGLVLVRGRHASTVRAPSGSRAGTGATAPCLPGRGRDVGDTRLRRVRAPGCYGYQIDGARFRTVVVFAARRRGARYELPVSAGRLQTGQRRRLWTFELGA